MWCHGWRQQGKLLLVVVRVGRAGAGCCPGGAGQASTVDRCISQPHVL